MAETFRPPQNVRDEAKRALKWIADGFAGSGFTDTGRARASQLARGDGLSAETILRMYSYLARHEVDKQGKGFNPGDEGYPSAGRVAWAAWGGDAGFTWSAKVREQLSARAALLEGQSMIKRDMMEDSVPDLPEELCELLADVVVFYFRSHGAHWNVKGSDFSEYHSLFNQIYEDVYGSIDPIAENMRKLGCLAPFRLADFMMMTEIADAEVGQDPMALARDLLLANDIVLDQISDTFDCATMLGQQGIANFLADRMDKHQYWKWQLTVSLGEEVTQPQPDPLNAQGIDEDDIEEEMPMAMSMYSERKAIGQSDLPLADREMAWDASKAESAVRAFAGGDNIDFTKYAKAFFYVDESAPDKFGSYKLQFADVVDGELKAVPRGIFAVAGVLSGARGGVDIPESDKSEIENKVSAYYDRMANEFDDAEMVAPFERAASARIGQGSFVSWNSSGGRARGKVVKVITKGTAASSDGYEMQATAEVPVFQIRIYEAKNNGYIPTEKIVVHKAEALTIITSLPAPRSEEIDMELRKSRMASAERFEMSTEIRAMDAGTGELRIGGYAAQFNKEATGLSFREVIAPGAFKRTLQSNEPVYLLVNHDTTGIPLASTSGGTLNLSEDEIGLRMEADLDPANPKAQELFSAISRGDIAKMSFAFTVAPNGSTREEGLRTLSDVNLFEVSAVTWPAYNDTALGLRTLEDNEAEALELRKRLLELKQKFNK